MRGLIFHNDLGRVDQDSWMTKLVWQVLVPPISTFFVEIPGILFRIPFHTIYLRNSGNRDIFTDHFYTCWSYGHYHLVSESMDLYQPFSSHGNSWNFVPHPLPKQKFSVCWKVWTFEDFYPYRSFNSIPDGTVEIWNSTQTIFIPVVNMITTLANWLAI